MGILTKGFGKERVGEYIRERLELLIQCLVYNMIPLYLLSVLIVFISGQSSDPYYTTPSYPYYNTGNYNEQLGSGLPVLDIDCSDSRGKKITKYFYSCTSIGITTYDLYGNVVSEEGIGG